MESLTVGTPVQLHVFRGDELIETTLLPAAAIADTWTLSLMESVTEEIAARRNAWLGQ
jgi:predicted metalloprotease with PDZ domain